MRKIFPVCCASAREHASNKQKHSNQRMIHLILFSLLTSFRAFMTIIVG